MNNAWKFGLLAAPLLLLTLPHAQQRASTRVAIVDVARVVSAAPGGASYAALRKEADANLQKQAQRVQTLQQKVASKTATAKDRTDLDAAVKTFNTSSANYKKQLEQKFAPVASTVNTAIKNAAAAQGFAIVLDANVAKTSGLIVYADTKTVDLTQAALNRLKK